MRSVPFARANRLTPLRLQNRDLASSATLQKTSVPSVSSVRDLFSFSPHAPTPIRSLHLGVSRRNSFGPIFTRTTLESFCFSTW